MITVHSLSLNVDTAEEQLPGFLADFPCLTTRAELQYYPDALVPWHWHPTAELFYMLEGSLDYHLPSTTIHMKQGDGGLLLPNILHRSSWPQKDEVVMLIHLFDPSLLFGRSDARMHRKYLTPLLSDTGLSFLPLRAGDPCRTDTLSRLRDSFSLDENQWEYEYQLRDKLCRLWLDFCNMPREGAISAGNASESEALKRMLSFIMAHLTDSLKVCEIAGAGNVSRRSCYRMFQTLLHTTPNAYIQAARLQKACALLEEPERTVTDIAMECGFGSASYFGRLFHRTTGKTPIEYRNLARLCE